MKLNEGMYIRTITGIIAKVDYIDDDVAYFDKDLYQIYGDSIDFLDLDNPREVIKISKYSFKIIDLIEEGDYVNSMKVNNIAIEDGLIYLHMDADECLHETDMLTGDDIELIVTKEQFKKISYKVSDDE